jgi:hypothetical protein
MKDRSLNYKKNQLDKYYIKWKEENLLRKLQLLPLVRQ